MNSPSAARVGDLAGGNRMSGDPAPGSTALVPDAHPERPADRIGLSRAGALTGLAGAALYVAGPLLPGRAPKPDAATSQVIAFFADKRGALLTGFSLELVALGFCFASSGISVPLSPAPARQAPWPPRQWSPRGWRLRLRHRAAAADRVVRRRRRLHDPQDLPQPGTQ